MRRFISWQGRLLIVAAVLMFFAMVDVIAQVKSTWTADDHGMENEACSASLVRHHHHQAADCAMKKTKLLSSRRLEDGSISFLATTNTDLVPTEIEDAHPRKVDTVDSMLRRTLAFHEIYNPQADNGTVPTVQLIRGGSEDDPELQNTGESNVLTVQHGLVSSVVDAYNNHLNLALRPDDIWIAILTQFAAYINGGNRAEILRQRFVRHQGQEKLKVRAPGNIYNANLGAMTSSLLEKIRDYFVDASMYEWFLPGFSTSTPNDEVCAAACAMCTTEKFFAFGFRLACGIPQVILKGTVQDWQMLRAKMNKLKEFDAGDGELLTWVSFLEVIGDNLVESAAGDGSNTNLEFWDTIAHHIGGTSATQYLSGWITTFSYFGGEGSVTPTSLDSEGLAMSIDVMRNTKPKHAARFNAYEHEYKKWPIIDSQSLASGMVSCPVRVDDNGSLYDARLFVGQMALNYVRATDDMKARATALNEHRRGELRLIEPRNDWALAIERPSL